MYRSCLLLIGLLLWAGCLCTEKECPAFPAATYAGLFPADTGQIIRFTNGTAVLPLTTYLKGQSEARTSGRYSGVGCSPYHPCLLEAYSRIGLADSAPERRISFTLRVKQQDTTEESEEAHYAPPELMLSDGAFNAKLLLSPALGKEGRDSVLQNVRFGNRQYERVVILTGDTIRYPYARVWRVYLANPGGIIAFEDRLTRYLYWQL